MKIVFKSNNNKADMEMCDTIIDTDKYSKIFLYHNYYPANYNADAVHFRICAVTTSNSEQTILNEYVEKDNGIGDISKVLIPRYNISEVLHNRDFDAALVAWQLLLNEIINAIINEEKVLIINLFNNKEENLNNE